MAKSIAHMAKELRKMNEIQANKAQANRTIYRYLATARPAANVWLT
jgi:hypothetical protein